MGGSVGGNGGAGGSSGDVTVTTTGGTISTFQCNQQAFLPSRLVVAAGWWWSLTDRHLWGHWQRERIGHDWRSWWKWRKQRRSQCDFRQLNRDP